MCDPITAAGAVLQAGGMAANSIGASAAARSRQRALEANQWQQMANQRAAFGAVDQGRAKYENFAPGMQKRTGEIGDYIQSNVNQASPDAMPKTTNAATQDALGAAAKTDSQTAQHGRSMAQTMGFGDYLHSTNLAAQRDIEKSAMFNDFGRGIASLLPGQLDRASHAGDTLMGLGGIATGLGRLGVGYGISNMYSPLAANLGVAPKVGGMSLADQLAAGMIPV